MWIQIHMDWATDPELPENPIKNDKNSLMTEKYPKFHTDARDECCLHILLSIDNNRLLLSSILVQRLFMEELNGNTPAPPPTGKESLTGGDKETRRLAS